jgi:uncharacterized protein with GYD domain
MRFLVMATHPPDLCPSSNGKIRELAKQSASEMPALAERLGVRLLDTFVTQINHKVMALVEADDIQQVRQLALDGRLVQWNTCEIYAVSTLQEAIATTEEMPTLY